MTDILSAETLYAIRPAQLEDCEQLAHVSIDAMLTKPLHNHYEIVSEFAPLKLKSTGNPMLGRPEDTAIFDTQISQLQKDIRRTASEQHHYLMLAEDTNGQACGYINYFFQPEKSLATIKEIYTVSKNGVGKQLVDHFKANMESANIRSAELVMPNKALAFFEKQGFKRDAHAPLHPTENHMTYQRPGV